MARIRKIEHGDRLNLVGHLDELRTRVVVSVAAFVVALGLCFWQNHLILQLVNIPLHGKKLLTLGVAEPFTTTLTLSAYAGFLLALPVVLYQLYAFILPAFNRTEKKVALPLMLMVPVLFVGGAAFAYFVVVPAALQFLLHFNADQFQTQLRAKEYYSFLTVTMIALGFVFQVPVGILGLTRLGITDAAGLREKRRYAWLGCAVVAAALPGVDPVTMLFEMVPLVLLYELSIILAAVFGGDMAREPDVTPSAP
ncbi:MAG: sec-independent protein translocase protein TatC [Thermoleophilaceae bacterium]|jgi:sec-independent protein translocase protein TatC|nr:sec-independent protein translocase protein TatC [Thermoleophilaceae bacterium]